MVQMVKSRALIAGDKMLFIEKPHVLSRIYFKISALIAYNAGYKSWISFDDPSFSEHYILDGSTSFFEAKGEGIFQGNIWVRNISAADVDIATTEILH